MYQLTSAVYEIMKIKSNNLRMLF